MLKSSIAAMETTEKASLISQRSISFESKLTLFNNFFITLLGAVVNHSGSWAEEACPIIEPSGFSPHSFAFCSLITNKAAAPSFNFDALAAVIVPSLAKAGLNFVILSNLTLPGSSSSITNTELPFR